MSQHIERIADTTSIVMPPWSCRGLLSESDNIVLRVHPITQRAKHDEVSPGQRDSPPPEKQDGSAATMGGITAERVGSCHVGTTGPATDSWSLLTFRPRKSSHVPTRFLLPTLPDEPIVPGHIRLESP